MLRNALQRIYRFSYKTQPAVQFSYKEISDVSSNLNERIKEAFGPAGLGLCIVSDIPNYMEFRRRLLPLSYKFATMPENQLKTYERPEAYHSKGWSCGVEQFKGKFDNSKGSLYNNPLYDEDEDLTVDQQKMLGEGMKLRIPNVWPKDTIPELEYAFKNLGRLMVDVGAMVSYHIDGYVASQCPQYKNGTLYKYIREGDQHLGRLLHYFSSQSDDVDWCGWHNDHSALTALTAPMYITQDGKLLEDYVDKSAGLLAKNRFSDITQVKMKQDCLAFQIGETAQIVTGGLVEATPHCVLKGQATTTQKLNRNTFALFMAPRFNTILNPPKGIDPQSAMNKDSYQVPSLYKRWHPDITFQEYSGNSFKAYSNY